MSGPRSWAWPSAGLYIATIFVSASLLFLVQPIAARLILPVLGGSPAVWNTAMVFFQALLLAGYGYAHLSVRRFGVARQAALQTGLVLLPLIALPIALPSWAPPDAGAAVPWALGALGVAVGLPFFVLATVAPTLQRWFAETQHVRASDPYFLYAASNAGSMLALLGYPFVLEPLLGVRAQTRVWSGLYVLFAGCLVACAALLLRELSRRGRTPDAACGAEAEANESGPIGVGRRALWLALSFAPSSLMLGVTQHLTTDISPVPLLWVIPLALYLASFVTAFSRFGAVAMRWSSFALPGLGVAAFGEAMASRQLVVPIALQIGTHLAMLLAAALLCHGRLAVDRPPPDRLTDFYLMLSVGGVLGGAFNALLAPVVFDSLADYPLAVFLCLLARPATRVSAEGPWRSLARDALLSPVPALMAVSLVVARGLDVLRAPHAVFVVLPLLLTLAFARRPLRFALALGLLAYVDWTVVGSDESLFADRTFFGVLEVSRDTDGLITLGHGTTLHGKQSRDPRLRHVPLSYYHPRGPLGAVFRSVQAGGGPRRIGVIGLGAGSIAAYGRAGDEMTFFEIDPVVLKVASDPRFFTFLTDCRARVETVVGDGRRELARRPDREFDLLVIDAFSSDAVPTHLLTREALALYLRKTAAGGMVALNLTNRYLDLSRLVAGAARKLGANACLGDDPREVPPLRSASTWVALAREAATLDALRAQPPWRPMPALGARLWTDDHTPLWGLFR